MLTETVPLATIIFVAGTVIAFGGFAVTLAWVEASTRSVRRSNHPIPGE